MTHKKYYLIAITGGLLAALSLTSALAAATAPSAPKTVPKNLGSGLRELAQAYESGHLRAFLQGARHLQVDSKNRVTVNIQLNGKATVDQVSARCHQLGIEVIVTNAGYRQGVISAHLPLRKVAAIAREKGVSAVVAVPRPVMSVGSVTAQSTIVHHTNAVNNPGTVTATGLRGEGMSIGVLSDSYNRGLGTAAAGVSSGNLPGPGNPVNSTPVLVLAEPPNLGPLNSTVYTDEGRGMLEIVADLAPKAKLSFATSYSTDVNFAQNIVSLRTDPGSQCDVIVDDVAYLNEPMFSDGIIAQAVDAVVTSAALPGKKVAYFSSAGNNGNAGYIADFQQVTKQVAATLTNQNLKFANVPAALYADGFHDFDPGPGIDISQSVTAAGGAASIVFQWDDPFDVAGGGITSDYNILIFDADGNYLTAQSGTDDNFSTNEPIELPASDLAADTTYQIVIARAAGGTKVANKIRYVFFPTGSINGEYLSPNGPTSYGHSASANAAAVAAYVYDDTPTGVGDTVYTPSFESFSSYGPATISFSSDGTRLPTAVVRPKPDFAAADGVNTSFFPPGDLALTDYEGDGFPNFFGTSAAAPTAAAIGALVLQGAGGPRSLSAAQVRQVLRYTAPPRDLDPQFSQASLAGSGLTATVTANGSDPMDANFFRVSFTAPDGVTVTGINFNLRPASLEFDPDPATGFPLTPGNLTTGVSAAGVTTAFGAPTTSGGFQTLLITLPAGNFPSTGLATFGIDRDVANVGAYGNSADLLEDAIVTIGFSNSVSLSAPFANIFGTGLSPADGAGFIDALPATQSVVP